MLVRKAASARRKIAQGLNPIDERKRDGGIPTFGEMADDVRETLAAGFRNEKHKAQWKSTLATYALPLHAKPVDTVTTDDVLPVLKPIWTTKAETASRVRGRIEKVLDAAKAKGFRNGENPARWRGHLDHLLPRPSQLSRGHHAAMPFEEVGSFIAKLRMREATAALALELCILTAARSGEILGMRWAEIDFDKKIWTVPPGLGIHLGQHRHGGVIAMDPLGGEHVGLDQFGDLTVRPDFDWNGQQPAAAMGVR